MGRSPFAAPAPASVGWIRKGAHAHHKLPPAFRILINPTLNTQTPKHEIVLLRAHPNSVAASVAPIAAAATKSAALTAPPFRAPSPPFSRALVYVQGRLIGLGTRTRTGNPK